MKINKSNTKKDEQNTKQIKYRRKLHLILLSLSFFGPMVPYLIIYLKKNTKHNEIQQKARRIQEGMCTEPKLTSNWHSRADTLSLPLLPACVFVIRDVFARKICSWTELFVNRGVREPRFHCTLYEDQYTIFHHFVLGSTKNEKYFAQTCHHTLLFAAAGPY
jgi:hypothetical protein